MAIPQVSVIMPAYNHAAFVAHGIRSVLDQDVPLELIVIDDGSKDGTWEEIERVRREDPRPFVGLHQENAGVCKTINRGVQLSIAPLVAIIASDDYFLPGKLRKQIEAFRQGGEHLGLVHTGAYLDYQQGRPLEDLTGAYKPATGLCYDEVLTQEVRIIAPSVVFRRAAFDALGGFDEQLAAEDVDFYLRLAAGGWEFAYVPEPLVVKRVVEGSAGSDLRRLIQVHEHILAKQRSRLSPQRYIALRRLMYEHLIILAAGSGQYRYATEAAFGLSKEYKTILPLFKLGFWSSRSALLRALPPALRHGLRLARSSVRTRWSKASVDGDHTDGSR